MKREISQAAVFFVITAFAASCAPAENAESAENTEIPASPSFNGATIEVEDNEGTKNVPFNPERVAALDDRARELLEALGVDVRDPGGRVDLVVATTAEGAAGARPNAAYVDLSPREEIPLDWEMVRQAHILGRIFGCEAEAAELDDWFTEARGRAIAARKDSWTFAPVTSDGNEITVQPGTGDALWQPLFEMLELSPALKPEDPADISALVTEKPTFLFVSEVQKDYSAKGYVPPMRVLSGSDELKELTAVEKGRVYVAPLNVQDTASIVAYTTMFNELADQWKALD